MTCIKKYNANAEIHDNSFNMFLQASWFFNIQIKYYDSDNGYFERSCDIPATEMCNSRVEIQTGLDAADDPIKLYENHRNRKSGISAPAGIS